MANEVVINGRASLTAEQAFGVHIGLTQIFIYMSECVCVCVYSVIKLHTSPQPWEKIEKKMPN